MIFNLCMFENFVKGIIYFVVIGDKYKFIECDFNGNVNVLICFFLLVWDESCLFCVYFF